MVFRVVSYFGTRGNKFRLKEFIHCLSQRKIHWAWRVRYLPYLPLLFLIMGIPVRAQQSVGYVFDVKGEWVIRGQNKTLSVGDSLPAGGVIEFRKASLGKSYIRLADNTGKPFRSVECFNASQCRSPITLPSFIPGNSSFLSRVVNGAMRFLRSAPDVYKSFISREGGELHEAVLQLVDGRVDLSAPFKDKANGKYLLRFVSKGSGQAAPAKEVFFEWNPKNTSPVAVPGVKPGLYEIQLLSLKDRERLEPGQEVWVLLIPPGTDFQETSSQFEMVLRETEMWNEKGFQGARRSFLRACLSYLDAQKRI